MSSSSPQDLSRAFLRVMARWTHEWMRLARARLRAQGLSVAQLMVLRQIQYGGPCSVSDVAQALGVSRAAASQMLDRLVEQGLVARQEDPRDRRHKRLTLTAEGRAFLEGMMDAHRAWAEAVLNRLAAEEREALAQALAALERAVGASGAAGDTEPSPCGDRP